MGQGTPKAVICLLCYFSSKSDSDFPKKIVLFASMKAL